jgi:hypothetical protein
MKWLLLWVTVAVYARNLARKREAKDRQYNKRRRRRISNR